MNSTFIRQLCLFELEELEQRLMLVLGNDGVPKSRIARFFGSHHQQLLDQLVKMVAGAVRNSPPEQIKPLQIDSSIKAELKSLLDEADGPLTLIIASDSSASTLTVTPDVDGVWVKAAPDFERKLDAGDTDGLLLEIPRVYPFLSGASVINILQNHDA